MGDALVPNPNRAAPAAQSADPDHDLDSTVRLAVRLGWVLAEVRGRQWWKGNRPASADLPRDPDYPLPLRPERTFEESRQQAFGTLAWISTRLQVDDPPAVNGSPGGEPYSRQLELLMRKVDADCRGMRAQVHSRVAESSARDQAWQDVAALMRAWDSAIQDELTARADILACAYLLGRGLAETYWALDPENEQPVEPMQLPEGDQVPAERLPKPGSWQFLLGKRRRPELTRLVGRLAPFLNPLTPVAVSGSLEAWGYVVGDPAWRSQPTARAALYEQLRRWYEILVLRQDPSTLVRPYALLHGVRTVLRASRAFWAQLLLALLSLAAVAGFVVLLTTGSSTALTKTLLGLGGTLGLSAATIISRAKSATQTLFTRLRQDTYSDLVAIEVTSVPSHPDDHDGLFNRRPLSRRLVEKAVVTRTLTVSTPGPTMSMVVVRPR